MAATRSETALVLLTLAFVAASALCGRPGHASGPGYSVQTGRRPTAFQLQEAALQAAAAEKPPVESEAPAAVDINSADAETLMTLPGVDSALAEAIVSYRRQYGPYARIDELYLFDGVDAALFEALRERVFCAKP